MQHVRKKIRFVFILLLVVILGTQSTVFAIDTEFYSANDILFYNPDARACKPGITESNLTEEEKIGQILYVGFDNDSIGKLKEAAQKYQLGGVYLNVQDSSKMSPDIAKDINNSLKSQLLISSDDEGGQVWRMLKNKPSAKQLGTMTDAEVTTSGKDTGTELKKLGLTGVLGPVLDIDTGLQNAISPWDRSFSSDPSVITQKALAWSNGVTDQGVGVTYKHFPGIGSNAGDTDKQYVEMTTKTKISDFTDDLKPYKDERLRDHKGASVMLANFVLPEWGGDPVSVNNNAVTYLRNTVGFKGMITTDDLAVMARDGYGNHKLTLDQSIPKALKAGVDMPLFGYPGEDMMAKIIAAVKKDVDAKVIDTAYNHVMGYKSLLGLYSSPATSTATTNATSPVVSGGDNEQKIFNFLISNSFAGYGNKPFGAVQAAGAVGNFFQESGWRFNAVEGNGEGHGIAQWSYERKNTLYQLASKMGKNWDDPEVQFQMLKNELDGSYGKALLDKGYDKLTDPKEASYIFQIVYESAGVPAQENRDKAAVEAYNKYKGLAPGSSFSSGCTTTTSTFSGNAKDVSFVTKDGFAVYLQTDERWANIPYSINTEGKSGCGPTSMAMIITALTGKVINIPEHIKVAVSLGIANSFGSSLDTAPKLAQYYGLKSKPIAKGNNTVLDINSVLKSGGLVSIAGNGPTPYFPEGHFIVIRGIDPDGKWRVGNSGDQASNEQSFMPEAIVASSQTGSIFAITK